MQSQVGSEGPCRGYEVLELAGVSLDQGDEKAFMKKFVSTQVRNPTIRHTMFFLALS